MAVRIRLSRAGAKKRPYYRIVVADIRSPRDGRFIERIGSFNPLLRKDDPKRLTIDLERAKHWLSNGAVATDRVATFLADANLMPKPKQGSNPQKAKPKAKAQERLKAAEAAAEAAKKAEGGEAASA